MVSPSSFFFQRRPGTEPVFIGSFQRVANLYIKKLSRVVLHSVSSCSRGVRRLLLFQQNDDFLHRRQRRTGGRELFPVRRGGPLDEGFRIQLRARRTRVLRPQSG